MLLVTGVAPSSYAPYVESQLQSEFGLRPRGRKSEPKRPVADLQSLAMEGQQGMRGTPLRPELPLERGTPLEEGQGPAKAIEACENRAETESSRELLVRKVRTTEQKTMQLQTEDRQ